MEIENVGNADAVNLSARPVFIVGCPRSGTTLLYHMILSSGDFAILPSESDTFSLVAARFPDLTSFRNRQKFLQFWLQTEMFAQSGLKRAEIEERLLNECRSAGHFLRIVMEALCLKQGVRRWAEKTPEHALFIREIKQSIPDSLIVHIIRDGRDAALSLANFGRLHPYFYGGGRSVVPFGVFWKWMVRKGRAAGERIGPDYYELHYEDLVEKPRATLSRLAKFIGHDLNYDRILRVGYGSVRQPDSSFRSTASSGPFSPVGRWRKQYRPEELERFESLVGDCLEEMGYPLATDAGRRRHALDGAVSAFYLSQLGLKQWLKCRTPLRRMAGRTSHVARRSFSAEEKVAQS